MYQYKEEIAVTELGDLVINIGPQHPATHGVLHLLITLNGETIKKVEPHVYRIDVLDGSYNKYFYNDGRCTKVKIHQSLYTITMALT